MAGSFALWCAMDMKLNGPGGYTTAPMIWKLAFVTLLPHLWMFCLGILLHRHFERVKKWVEGKVLIYLALYIGAMWLQHTLLDDGSIPFYLCYFPSRVILAFATISAAYSCRPLSGYLLRGTDISYGVYIYHSVVINVLIEAHLTQSPWALCWVLGTSIVLALLSWTLVEKPALACKTILPRLPWLRRRLEEGNVSK
jgi:peptidoglycan/LPS O-acetylase OafA/YrhL